MVSISVTVTSRVSPSRQTLSVTQEAAAPVITATATAEGNWRTITVTSNGSWTVHNLPEWIVLSRTGGTGNASVQMTLLENPSSSAPRSHVLEFRCGTMTALLHITQAAAEPQVHAHVSGQGDVRTIHVQSNGFWIAKELEVWLNLNAYSGEGDGEITLRMTENPSSELPRRGWITLTCGEAVDKLEIVQEPAQPEITATAAGEGDSRTITVTANGSWTATPEADWISLSGESGSGTTRLTATLAENPASTPRTGRIRFVCGNVAAYLSIEQAASATPFHVRLPEAQRVSLARQKSVPVYSGPGKNYFRAANGLAECSPHDPFLLWGYTEGWYMISYSTNGGGNRIGYIQQGTFTGRLDAEVLTFADKPARTTQKVNVTDDPDGLRKTVATLSSGTNVTYLATHEKGGSNWYYIECTVSGKKMRGFIPANTLEIR